MIKSLQYYTQSLKNFSIAQFSNYLILKLIVGRSGFEPLKSKDSGFTVRPIWPLWNLPYCMVFPPRYASIEPLVGIEPTTY